MEISELEDVWDIENSEARSVETEAVDDGDNAECVESNGGDENYVKNEDADDGNAENYVVNEDVENGDNEDCVETEDIINEENEDQVANENGDEVDNEGVANNDDESDVQAVCVDNENDENYVENEVVDDETCEEVEESYCDEYCDTGNAEAVDEDIQASITESPLVEGVAMEDKYDGDIITCAENDVEDKGDKDVVEETSNQPCDGDNTNRADDPYPRIREVTDTHIKKIEGNLENVTMIDLMKQMDQWKTEMKKEISETLKIRHDPNQTAHPIPECPSSSSIPESVQRELLAKDNKISLLQSKLVDKMESISTLSQNNDRLQQELLEKEKTISSLNSRMHQIDGHTLEHAHARIKDLEALADNLQQQNHLFAVSLEEKDNHLYQLQTELYNINELYSTLYAEKARLENAVRMLEVESSCRCQPRPQFYTPPNSHRTKPSFGHSFSAEPATCHQPKHEFAPVSDSGDVKDASATPTKNVRFAADDLSIGNEVISDEKPSTGDVDDGHYQGSSASAPESGMEYSSASYVISSATDAASRLGTGLDDVTYHSDDVIGMPSSVQEVDVIIYHDSTFPRISGEEILKEEGLIIHTINTSCLSDVIDHLTTSTSQPRIVLLHAGADDVAHIQEDVVVETILEIRQISHSREINFIWSCILPTPGNSTLNRKRQVVNALVSSKVSFMKDVTVVRHDDLDAGIMDGHGVGNFVRSIKLGICKSLGIAYAHLLKDDKITE